MRIAEVIQAELVTQLMYGDVLDPKASDTRNVGPVVIRIVEPKVHLEDVRSGEPDVVQRQSTVPEGTEVDRVDVVEIGTLRGAAGVQVSGVQGPANRPVTNTSPAPGTPRPKGSQVGLYTR